jgi:hypothetical protein
MGIPPLLLDGFASRGAEWVKSRETNRIAGAGNPGLNGCTRQRTALNEVAFVGLHHFFPQPAAIGGSVLLVPLEFLDHALRRIHEQVRPCAF